MSERRDRRRISNMGERKRRERTHGNTTKKDRKREKNPERKTKQEWPLVLDFTSSSWL